MNAQNMIQKILLKLHIILHFSFWVCRKKIWVGFFVWERIFDIIM